MPVTSLSGTPCEHKFIVRFRTIVLMFLAGWFSFLPIQAQEFRLGVDLSYANEMEDCGVIYREAGLVKDIYDIFQSHGCQLVRLRLWHTPSWYDALNQGARYGDLNDVKRSIHRAKQQNMQVLLAFHLSDFWADPSRQWTPGAWSAVQNNLPVLQDSLYGYLFTTLMQLDAEGLLPEIVQLGNETNRDILMPTGMNLPWQLNWNRNAPLFNTAIQAVRAAAAQAAKPIEIALHIAGPQNAEWMIDGFTSHGVHDFDIIGMSYYWPYHKPVTIGETGSIVARLKSRYPNKQVMILETGSIWTTAANDQAVNVLNEIDPAFAPVQPEAQRDWLIALTKEVYENGGSGVLYWEPDWVSSSCRTYWAQGSHYENAAFFDFNNNLLLDGGIAWLADYTGVTSRQNLPARTSIRMIQRGREIEFQSDDALFDQEFTYRLINALGQIIQEGNVTSLPGTGYLRVLQVPYPLRGWICGTLFYKGRAYISNPGWIPM